MIKLGCSLHSFSFIKLPSFYMFLKSCINKMYKQGIRYFELPIWHTFTVEDSNNIRSLIKSYAECYSVHLPKQLSAKDILNNADLLEGVLTLKPSIAVLHVQSVANFNDDYIKLDKIFKSYNCQLCIEFIAYENELKELFNSLNHSVNITLDIYHCINAGFSVEEIIKRYSKMIRHIHFNDYRETVSKALCPGEGNLPLNQYINLLKQQNYGGIYMLECNFDCEEHFIKILTILNSVNDV